MDNKKLLNNLKGIANNAVDTIKNVDYKETSKVLANKASVALEKGKELSGVALEKSKEIGNTALIKGKELSDKIKENKEKKNEIVFQNVESLQQVVNVVNEASIALNDKTRTIRESSIPEVILGAVGAGVGGVGSFVALYGLGTVGLSAAGITSGLATAGAVVGGGMAAGIFVLAAPVAALAGIGVFTAAQLKSKQLKQEKERLYKEALAKHDAIINTLNQEVDASKERIEYLQGLNTLLKQAVKDLKHDIELIEN